MTFPFHLPRWRYCNHVAAIIEYPIALAKLLDLGMVCNYFNGGAFGFPKNITTKVFGWTAGEDASIRAELRSSTKAFSQPAAEKMAEAASSAWINHLPGPAWIMPLSHWAFELDFGSKSWLAPLLESVQVKPFLLANRADASPLEFQADEQAKMKMFVQSLLENLSSSDFMLAFPEHPVLCTIHHHKQLWWISSDRGLLEQVDSMAV
jgi:hypothetical protein